MMVVVNGRVRMLSTEYTTDEAVRPPTRVAGAHSFMLRLRYRTWEIRSCGALCWRPGYGPPRIELKSSR